MIHLVSAQCPKHFCPGALTEHKCDGHENLGTEFLWDILSVTQGPGPEMGQEERQISFPNSEYPDPPIQAELSLSPNLPLSQALTPRAFTRDLDIIL